MTYLTPRKMRRILAYAKKRKFPVKITYIYANSIGWFEKRSYTGIISSYAVTSYEWADIQVDIFFSDGSKLHEYLNHETFFTESSPNRTALAFCNSGPYCQFIIERIPE